MLRWWREFWRQQIRDGWASQPQAISSVDQIYRYWRMALFYFYFQLYIYIFILYFVFIMGLVERPPAVVGYAWRIAFVSTPRSLVCRDELLSPPDPRRSRTDKTAGTVCFYWMGLGKRKAMSYEFPHFIFPLDKIFPIFVPNTLQLLTCQYIRIPNLPQMRGAIKLSQAQKTVQILRFA